MQHVLLRWKKVKRTKEKKNHPSLSVGARAGKTWRNGIFHVSGCARGSRSLCLPSRAGSGFTVPRPTVPPLSVFIPSSTSQPVRFPVAALTGGHTPNSRHGSLEPGCHTCETRARAGWVLLEPRANPRHTPTWLPESWRPCPRGASLPSLPPPHVTSLSSPPPPGGDALLSICPGPQKEHTEGT